MVLNDLKNRGLKCTNILNRQPSGFNSHNSSISKSRNTKCIIHQIRSSTRYVNYKDIKDLMNDLKTIYKANTEETALVQLDYFEDKWNKKYPACVNSWKTNWAELSTFFKYPPEIRKLMYTTNAIENFNRQLRKVTKNKTIFPTDFSLEKSLYLAMVNATAKWTSRMRGWDQILGQLQIFFEEILES